MDNQTPNQLPYQSISPQKINSSSSINKTIFFIAGGFLLILIVFFLFFSLNKKSKNQNSNLSIEKKVFFLKLYQNMIKIAMAMVILILLKKPSGLIKMFLKQFVANKTHVKLIYKPPLRKKMFLLSLMRREAWIL